MNLRDRLEACLMELVDAYFARRPLPRCDRQQVESCRLVSHRGEHDNRRVFENTLAAFDAAAAAGVWGLELDLRWTRDLEPVVIHDADLARVFGVAQRVAAATLAQLRAACPLVPTLAEVVGRYGGRSHLMIEVKFEEYPDPAAQNEALSAVLAPLIPGADFHLISLTPEMFGRITAAPKTCFVPIARFDACGFARLALREGYAGIAGHYVMVRAGLIRRLHAAGLRAGTGYSDSPALLLRELGRGVDWIFSNRAAAMQRALAGIYSASNRAA